MPRIRTERLTERLTIDEKKFILKKMREAGYKNVSDFFLHCICKQNTVVIDTMPILEVKDEINKIGVNVNQIAKVANTNKYVSQAMLDRLKCDLQEVKDIVNKGFYTCVKERDNVGLCKDSTDKTGNTS